MSFQVRVRLGSGEEKRTRGSRSKVWRIGVAVMTVLTSVASLTAWVDAASGRLTTVRLSEVVRSVFYAPQYVALSKGFFEDEGLKIELSTAQGADKGAAALLSGTVDIGFFGPEAAIYIYNQGAKDYLVGFAQLTARDGSFLMARDVTPDKFKWEMLRGKTLIGARKGGVPQMVLEWVLRKHGLDPNKDLKVVTNLAFEAALPAFQAGLGDYIAQFEPLMSQMEKSGVGYVVASLGMEGGEITYTVYHARKSFLEKNPDLLVRFTRALYRGMRWVQQHSITDVADAVAPFFPGIDRDVLLRTLDRYRKQNSWRETPQISPAGFAQLQRIMKAAGQLDKEVPFEALMTNTIANQAVATYEHE